jgi:hypothetical protein
MTVWRVRQRRAVMPQFDPRIRAWSRAAAGDRL